MSLTIPVAHDFICPWCWVGIVQVERLKKEFDIEIEWLGYELYPEELEWPTSTPSTEPANKPKTPSRFQFILYADNMELPKSERPSRMRSHNAHLAVEHAKEKGLGGQLVEALYRAYWERGVEINNVDRIVEIAVPLGLEEGALRASIAEDRHAERIIHFDDDAYANGVYNVPTFFIGEERLAEQPYTVLRRAIAKAVQEA